MARQLTCRWLLEYDSATFASYINTLQRQHFRAEKFATGAARHVHDWFNAKAASNLVEVSQARISKLKIVMDNEEESPTDGPAAGRWGADDHADDEEALRDLEASGQRETNDEMEEDEDVMEIVATQSAARPEPIVVNDEDEEDEEMREIGEDEERQPPAPIPAPPIFPAVAFDYHVNVSRSVEKRLRKGHEVVLEEQPKWSLLAKVLKEIEDTIARVQDSHAGKCAFLLIQDPGLLGQMRPEQISCSS